MEIVIFGAGSLGSLLGGLLATEHRVTLVGRDPHVSAVRSGGLRVNGEFDRLVRPAATTDGNELTADLALVAVKSYDTERAARVLSTGKFDAALSVQNGLGNERVLAEHVQCPVLAGTATYGAQLDEPGRVICTGRGDVTIGHRNGGHSALAEDVASAFRTAGVDAEAVTDMPRRLWKKLAINAGINPTTALARVPNGALDDGPASTLARTAAAETARVARAEGVELSDETALQTLADVIEATAKNRSSMYQDVLAKRRTEVGAINGAILDRAKRHDVEVPINRALAALVRSWEQENANGIR